MSAVALQARSNGFAAQLTMLLDEAKRSPSLKWSELVGRTSGSLSRGYRMDQAMIFLATLLKSAVCPTGKCGRGEICQDIIWVIRNSS